MISKLDKTLITAHLSHLEHHSSYWARENNENLFRSEWAHNLTKTFRTAQLSQLERHWAHSEQENVLTFFFASTELKTWQNIHNGSVKTLGASQLILSERKKLNIFSLRMSSKLDKTFRMAQLSHLEHHSLFWAREEQWQCFFAPNDLKTWQNVPNGSVKPVESITAHCERENFFIFLLRMSSKLDKTFWTAKLSHLEHHSSFWARETMQFFLSEWAQNLTKHS